MPRLIALLLVLASLAILAVQNLSTALPLVILSSETPAIPVGLLLVGSVGLGSLIALALYGLVGLGRTATESKYRPMGRRVPYPDSPGSTNLPPSGPATGPSTSSNVYQPTSPSYGGGSTAFVSQPANQPASQPVSQPATLNQPVASQETPSKPSSTTVQDSSVTGTAKGSSATSASVKKGVNSFRSHFGGGRAPSAPVPDSSPSAKPMSTIDEAPNAGGKTKKKLNAKKKSETET